MKTQREFIILEDVTGFSPTQYGVDYTDTSGAKIHIPMTLLVRLYEGTKFDFERKGVNWDEFCKSLFS